MSRIRAPYDGVVVAIPVTVPYERYSEQPAHWWTGRALRGLIERSGLAPSSLDGLSLSSFTLAPDPPVAIAEHMGLSPRFLEHVPLGGASGVVALRHAARAVQCGDAEVVACVAADTHHRGGFKDLLSGFSRFTQDASYPYGSGGPNASFALLTDYYMRTYGATAEDFGALCVAQRANAVDFPHALLRKPLSMRDYLDSRLVADPIRLFDCVMPCAGAEAFLVADESIARRHRWPFARILATIERHNAFVDDPIQYRGGWAMDRNELWQEAGVQPGDVSFLQTYDDYPVISMLQLEDLGFCAKGEAPAFVREHDLTVAGTFPHNTSGGQLSVGQAGAAGGSLGLVEAVRQLTGSTLGDAVDDAEVGVVSGFGMINYDRGLSSAAAVLGRC